MVEDFNILCCIPHYFVTKVLQSLEIINSWEKEFSHTWHHRACCTHYSFKKISCFPNYILWGFYTVLKKLFLEISLWDDFFTIYMNLNNSMLKAETPVLWPPHAKSWLIGKDSDAGRDWGQEEKGTTEDKMAGWHHWFDGRESQWTLGVGDGQGGLACCDSWGHKESDTTERLNWTELK